MNTTIEGGKVAPERATRLNPLLGLKSIADRPRSTLQGSVLPGLGIQGCLQHTRGRGGVGQIFLQVCSKQIRQGNKR
jgi:hypothetical protein